MSIAENTSTSYVNLDLLDPTLTVGRPLHSVRSLCESSVSI